MAGRRRVPLGPEDLERTVADAIAALRPGAGLDWTVPAGRVRWTCTATLFHAADDQVAYAGQLAARATSAYLPFRLRQVPRTPPERLFELLTGMATILAATARDTPRTVRAWHPYGMADAEGFLAMGIAEVLLHTHDVAQGLGLPYAPDADTCARVVGRLHTGLEPHDDPWALLLWATGRGDLPGRPPIRRWRWDPRPFAERTPAAEAR